MAWNSTNMSRSLRLGQGEAHETRAGMTTGIVAHHGPHQQVGNRRDLQDSPAQPDVAAAWISSSVATLALRPANRPMKASMLPWEWAARTPMRPPGRAVTSIC